MEKKEKRHFRFGLLGKNISYSFSRAYFTEKFKSLGLENHSYENFDLQEIADFPELILSRKDLGGLNVTIPYKQTVIRYLDNLHPVAAAIGAVNTIKFTEAGLVGYNTDAYGFENAIVPLLREHHKKALILGTGGASKAIAYVFGILGISFKYVSRTPGKGQLSYHEINEELIQEYPVLVNCSPVGTFPDSHAKPAIPYDFITPANLLFDLIYNPPTTTFLAEGENRGATISNGHTMLQLQAEKAWEIWNS